MRRLPALLAVLALLTACQTAPLTHRRQFLPFPASVENEIGENAWAETLAAAQADGSLVTTGPRAQRVQRVGKAIEAAAKRHPETKELAESYDWQFVLLASNQVNAWALPGGKCAAYTGLLDVATEESELAADAGYDPRGAVTLWQKMGALGGERPPELLSTHPSEATRIADLEDLMPKATKVWNKAKAAGR